MATGTHKPRSETRDLKAVKAASDAATAAVEAAAAVKRALEHEEKDADDIEEDESAESDNEVEESKAKKPKSRDLAEVVGEGPHGYLAYRFEEGKFRVVESWTARNAYSPFNNHYIIIPKIDTPKGRAAFQRRLGKHLEAIGFAPPDDECNYNRRCKIINSKETILDKVTFYNVGDAVDYYDTLPSQRNHEDLKDVSDEEGC